MFSIFKRIKKLEDKLEEHIDKTKRAFDTCKKTDEKLSDWDDDRRAEIRVLAEAAGLRIEKGTHLVPNEEDDC
jgi:hypothetical protein